MKQMTNLEDSEKESLLSLDTSLKLTFTQRVPLMSSMLKDGKTGKMFTREIPQFMDGSLCKNLL
jgi:hypothetical protein